MGKSKSASSGISARATAKVEAVAKATYQRKKTTTEVVPPDVTRAKAGAWLTLLSPITEWAGLKGDALNFKRRLLRVQQEETLLSVAQSVRAKLAGEEVVRPVPRKILIPALEKASLEEATDQIMIDRWSNLLASAALSPSVQPRYVGILEELAGVQAECLERIAFNNGGRLHFPSAIFDDSPLDFSEYNVRGSFERAVYTILRSGIKADSVINMFVEAFSRPGVLLELAMIINREKDIWEVFDSVAETGIRDDKDISILESLGLLRLVVLDFDVPLKRKE